jgi:hypothetical protein
MKMEEPHAVVPLEITSFFNWPDRVFISCDVNNADNIPREFVDVDQVVICDEQPDGDPCAHGGSALTVALI